MKEQILANLEHYSKQIQEKSQKVSQLENDLGRERNEVIALQGAYGATASLAMAAGIIDKDGKLIEQQEEQVTQGEPEVVEPEIVE